MWRNTPQLDEVTLAPGSTFGPYKILEPLGRGGMASVFRAYEPGLDRYVALKVLPAEAVRDEASAERFRREARVIARLEHPNITPIHNFGIDEATQIPWMAMRLISGGTFGSRLTMKITPSRATAVLRGVAEALDYAHGKGVVHRDVKPANVLLDDAGRVYLADFGIARLVEGATALTAAGLISGTPAYMAPEQATGVSLDHRVDVYALGVVAYEALTGRVPFAGDNPIDVLMKHVQAPVPDAELPPPVMQVLRKALAKSPDDRWESAGALVSALEASIAATMPDAGMHPTPAPMPALAATAAGAGVTAASADPTRRSAPPTRPSAPRPQPQPQPDDESDAMLAAPDGMPTAVAAAPGRAWGPGLIAVVVGGIGVVGLAVAAGLYLLMAPRAPATDAGPEVAAIAPAITRPGDTAPSTPPDDPAGRVAPEEPAVEPPAVSAGDPPAVTLPPVRRPPDTRPPERVAAVEPATTVAAPAPAATLPPATVAPAQTTLRIDVNAVQPSFGTTAAAVDIDVNVDGRPMRSVTLRFEGANAFARSRRRQTFEIPGVPAGRRLVAVTVRSEGALLPVEARTEMTLADGAPAAVLDVRLRGNGEGDAKFR